MPEKNRVPVTDKTPIREHYRDEPNKGNVRNINPEKVPPQNPRPLPNKRK